MSGMPNSLPLPDSPTLSRCLGSKKELSIRAQRLSPSPPPQSDLKTRLSPSNPINACASCSRPTKIYGFVCKCLSNFCKKHRLPETHSCTFDFQREGKIKLALENPYVGPEKVVPID